MMSKSLRESMQSPKEAVFEIHLNSKCVFSSSHVYSFQKSEKLIEVVCLAPLPQVVLKSLQSLTHKEIVQLNYHGTKFENQKCEQWCIVPSELSLTGETRLELNFKLVNKTPSKEILND